MHGLTGRSEIVVGARGSALSVRQTGSVIALLQKLDPARRFVFKKIVTLGDRKKEWSRTDTGIFVKEIEEALLRGEIDIAVHSVKDLPSRIAQGVRLAAIPLREDPRDLLITARGTDLAGLPAHARIGTSSLRRRAQLLRLRADLDIEDLRGNLDTRIRQVREGRYDAIVVACAGLRRLEARDAAFCFLPLDAVLPAPGQGALGLEVREDDALAAKMVAALDHRDTHLCVASERAFLRQTQAGCRMPVAALASIDGQTLELDAMVISLDGKRQVRLRQRSRIDPADAVNAAQALGQALADRILAGGGSAILEEIRNVHE